MFGRKTVIDYGTTAVVCVVQGRVRSILTFLLSSHRVSILQRVFIANVGDSRCVLFQRSAANRSGSVHLRMLKHCPDSFLRHQVGSAAWSDEAAIAELRHLWLFGHGSSRCRWGRSRLWLG
jgi:hypothetical protein